MSRLVSPLSMLSKQTSEEGARARAYDARRLCQRPTYTSCGSFRLCMQPQVRAAMGVL